MKKWLFNPFIYIAGTRALVIGWAFIIVTSVIGYFSKCHFHGVLDITFSHTPAPLWLHFAEPVIDWLCAAIVLFLAGRIFSKSAIRFIDVAGTVALSRWPMIFCTIIGFGIVAPDVHQPLADLQRSITPSFLMLSLLSVVFCIWSVVLLYNAFVVSCNVKGTKGNIAFIAGLLAAEVLSEIIFYFYNI